MHASVYSCVFVCYRACACMRVCMYVYMFCLLIIGIPLHHWFHPHAWVGAPSWGCVCVCVCMKRVILQDIIPFRSTLPLKYCLPIGDFGKLSVPHSESNKSNTVQTIDAFLWIIIPRDWLPLRGKIICCIFCFFFFVVLSLNKENHSNNWQTNQTL